MSTTRKTKIAMATPFEGAPIINLPSIFGASPKKPILLRIPVVGQRPLEITVLDLPLGLTLRDNILSGQVEKSGEYPITVKVKNQLGEATKQIVLEIKEQNVLVTPLLGYTTWNAFGSAITQEKIEGIAKKTVDLGISEYGYGYVNTDSGWQGKYGGDHDAIMPNEKFPNMRAMTDKIHAYGLKCGIYSTPMLNAWGCPCELESIPGCTQGEPDHRYAPTNGGIGVIHKEKNNARQWDEWGFDYLKYDWAPTDPVIADLMRTELVKLSRDFGFCVTVCAYKEYGNYWSKYCNSYRSNADTNGSWEKAVEIYESYFPFAQYACRGHYFDLDMLDFGTCHQEALENALTEDEIITQFSIRAFLNSPIQISSTLESPTDFELSVYCNEEILKINQDCAFKAPRLIASVKEGERYLHVYEKELEDGAFAYAIFNLGEQTEAVELVATSPVRDLWAKETLEERDLLIYPHATRIFKSNEKIEINVK